MGGGGGGGLEEGAQMGGSASTFLSYHNKASGPKVCRILRYLLSGYPPIL